MDQAASNAGATESGDTGANASAAGSAPTSPWANLDPDTQGWIQAKGYQGVGDVVGAYRNAEKLLGVPPDQLVRMPKSPEDKDAWGNVFNKIGRPEKAEGYKFEGVDPETVKPYAQVFHDMGLTNNQVNALLKLDQARQGEAKKLMEEQRVAKNGQEEAALKGEWGTAFEQNVELAKRATAELGISAEQLDALESALGFAGAVKLMHNLGTKVGEAAFVEGKAAAGNQMTPAAATAEMGMLRRDQDFMRKWVAGDEYAVKRMNDLVRMSVGGVDEASPY